MQILKRAVFAGLALAVLASFTPASAQYYPPDGPPDYPGSGPGYDGGWPGYDTDDYPQPRYRLRYRPRYETPYYQPRARIGSTCATRRGSCDLNDGRPVGTSCRCYIPGFGPKRGLVQP